jgi:hypothetical protein
MTGQFPFVETPLTSAEYALAAYAGDARDYSL